MAYSNCQPCLAKQLVLRSGVVHRPTGMARFNQPFSFLIDVLIFLPSLNGFIMHKRRSNIHCLHQRIIIDSTFIVSMKESSSMEAAPTAPYGRLDDDAFF